MIDNITAYKLQASIEKFIIDNDYVREWEIHPFATEYYKKLKDDDNLSKTETDFINDLCIEVDANIQRKNPNRYKFITEKGLQF